MCRKVTQEIYFRIRIYVYFNIGCGIIYIDLHNIYIIDEYDVGSKVENFVYLNTKKHILL